jgi:hypothetical protein
MAWRRLRTTMNITKTLTLGGVLVAFGASLLALGRASAQGTIRFDGPPIQPPGTSALVQSYSEMGVWFLPIPGTDGFIRQGSNPAAYWPDNGTAHVVASLGDSLMFGLDSGSEFRLESVDLAEWSTAYPDPVSVRFVGYRADGSTVTTDLVTDGIIDGTGPTADFQTLFFGPEFSGLVQVRIPNSVWSLDNLRLSVPEPGPWPLLLTGGLFLWVQQLRRSN